MLIKKMFLLFAQKGVEKSLFFELRLVLQTLENNILKTYRYKDIILPSNANLKECYHTHCYENIFLLLKKYYYDYFLIK